jgi:putative tricarboxylic transport membrane protein
MPPSTETPPPGEAFFASLLLLMSGFLLWSAHGISGFGSTVSAGAFPMGAAAVMVVCALVFLERAVRRAASGGAMSSTAAAAAASAGDGGIAGVDASPSPAGPAGWRRIVPPVLLWNTLALAGYMLALETAGFHVSSVVFLLLSMRLLGSTRWGLNVAVAAGAVAAIHVVFQTVFSVVLPAGTLWQG